MEAMSMINMQMMIRKSFIQPRATVILNIFCFLHLPPHRQMKHVERGGNHRFFLCGVFCDRFAALASEIRYRFWFWVLVLLLNTLVDT